MRNAIFSFSNPKAAKAIGYGWLNAIHYMAPHTSSGIGNLCPNASPQCVKLCLGVTSGAAVIYNRVKQSRIDKARRFMISRREYMSDMVSAIKSAERKANKLGLKLCIRLNGSTDIQWESIKADGGLSLPDMFPHIQFTEYTKIFTRMLKYCSSNGRGHFPNNLHLTFSYSGENWDECEAILARTANVAMVFGNGLPDTYKGYRVIDGDKHDLRHLDVCGVIVGLSPKGWPAKKDRSGFVIWDY